jgi:hypothetical protein
LPKKLRGNYVGSDDVDASSPTNVWAVGHGIERWNGRRWSLVSSTGPQGAEYLDGVDVISPKTAWVIGGYPDAVVARYSG